MFQYFKFLITFFFIFFNFNDLVASEKIMFVDINFIFSNSIVGKDISNKLNSEIKKNQNNLKILKNKLTDDERKLLNQQNILSEEEFNTKLIGLKSKINEFNNQQIELNNQIDLKKKKIKNLFSKELGKVIQEYANKNNIDLIIDKTTILIGKNFLDATEDVLELFDKNIKTINIK